MIHWLSQQFGQTPPNLIADLVALPVAFAWHHRAVLRSIDDRFRNHERTMKQHVDKATGTQEAGKGDGSNPGDQR